MVGKIRNLSYTNITMGVQELLLKLREDWFQRVSNFLAEGETVRDVFADELNRFYDLMLQAVETSDPGLLKPLMMDWAQSRTESDMDYQISSPPILSAITNQTFEIAKKELEADQALELITALIPVFTYCFEELAYHETLARVGDISAELETVKRDLLKIDRSKSDFISVAAHELKTPLTLIEGYASMLREKITQDDNDTSTVSMLKGIDTGTRRLGEIVSDMIDISLIDNDLLALSFQPTWINRLLDILQKEVENSIAERGQILEIRAFEGSDVMTFADTERLYQVLQNLITNAIKYTPDGGKITIDGRLLAGFIEVLIIDSGIGVNKDDHERIFEKFGTLGDAALHSSGKLKFKGGGPGLGLPIVRGLLEAHGGTIWVESEGYDEIKMPGSTFHILIPIREEPPDKKLSKIYAPLKRIKETE